MFDDEIKNEFRSHTPGPGIGFRGRAAKFKQDGPSLLNHTGSEAAATSGGANSFTAGRPVSTTGPKIDQHSSNPCIHM